MSISVLADTPQMKFGAFDSLLVCVDKGNTTVEVLDALAAHEQALIDQYGQVTLLMIFKGSPRDAGAEARERSRELAERFRPYVRASVVVVQTRGLGGVIMRTFLAAFSLVSPIPLQVASSIADATALVQKAEKQSAAVKGHPHLARDVEAFVQA